MVLPRTAAFGSMFRSSTARTARIRSTSHNWRTAGRRTYASGHGPAKKSSDLPWFVNSPGWMLSATIFGKHFPSEVYSTNSLHRMIGSVVVTVPSAAWLWQQGPKKGEHGHGHDEHDEHEEHGEGEEESKNQSGEEGKEEGEETPKDDAEAKPDDGDKADSGEKDDGSDSESNDEQETPATSDDGDAPEGNVKKGKGEKQKGATRPKTESKGEKDVSCSR
jgi:hypothetical protein